MQPCNLNDTRLLTFPSLPTTTLSCSCWRTARLCRVARGSLASLHGIVMLASRVKVPVGAAFRRTMAPVVLAILASMVQVVVTQHGALATGSGFNPQAHHEPIPLDNVFAAGEEGYAAFRIPGLLAFKGTLLAFAEGRKYGCGDFAGTHDIVQKRSTDGGRTWSNLTVLLDPLEMFGASECGNVTSAQSSCEFWDPTPVGDRSTGEIFLMTALSRSQRGRMGGQMTLWLLRSPDLGGTWGRPENITSQVWSERWKLMTPGNGHATQLSGGRLLFPGYIREGTDSTSSCAVIYSDDHGQSWRFGEQSLIGGATSECEVVELQRNQSNPPRLLMDVRRSEGSCGDGVAHCRWRSYSGDEGITWSPISPVPILPDPVCAAGIVAWPKKQALLFSNAASTTGRVNITLKLSEDDGATWPHSQVGQQGACER